MDEKTLAEWEALANAATEGPWTADAEEGRVTGPDLGTVADVPHAGDASNARFIAAAREAVPALVAEVRRLRELLAAIESDALLSADVRDAARAALGRDAQGRGGYRTKAEREAQRLRGALAHARSCIYNPADEAEVCPACAQGAALLEGTSA